MRLAPNSVDRLAEERLRRGLALHRLLDRPVGELEIDVRIFRQRPQRRGRGKRRAVGGFRPGEMVEDDPHLGKPLDDGFEQRQADDPHLHADRQALVAGVLPDREGGLVGEERLLLGVGRAGGEDAHAGQALAHPVLHLLHGVGRDHVDREHAGEALRMRRDRVRHIGIVERIGRRRLHQHGLVDAGRLVGRHHVRIVERMLGRPVGLLSEQRLERIFLVSVAMTWQWVSMIIARATAYRSTDVLLTSSPAAPPRTSLRARTSCRAGPARASRSRADGRARAPRC